MKKLSTKSILDYPRSLQENLNFRVDLYQACEVDRILQADIRILCRKDIFLWIDLFCYTKDQRRRPDVLPFICYDYERKYISEIQTAIKQGEDLLTEKSRDMGVSWMILYVFTHFWLFESGSDFRVGSRKEDFVDKLGDIDTLLEKIRFNLKRQPTWLLPKGFNPDDHCGYMRIINPENGNAIVGESANLHFASGGRRKAILLDEFAKWDDGVADAAWTATADVALCRLPVSTPVGSGNKFAQLAAGTKEKIKKCTLHWTLHPEKAKDAYYLDNGVKIPVLFDKANDLWRQGIKIRSPWYDAEAERRSESDLAQEVDIDYLRSGRPFFNIQALSNQKEWQYFERKSPADPIPRGFHIRVKLVEVDNKVELRECQDGWLRIYELPAVDMQYIVTADVAEGLAKGDESFAVVRDRYTRNVVADCNGLYPPDDFALKLQKMGKFYHNDFVVPENNNHGYSVCQDLKVLDCKLYYSKRVSPDGRETITKAGWTTDARTRPDMLDQLAEEIRRNVVELRSPVLIAQCKTFVNNERTGKPEADGSFLDDGVIACAIGSALIKELPYKNIMKRSDRIALQRRAADELRARRVRY